ncbi:MFS transporter [Burkholderia glumae]|uniref:MFS transporter n=2 Tax=Burkholderia glumae TaxID=337 RepID=A0AAP9Y2V2_BURGL|nr:MFS transporter [Burkholderia glumae]ACR28820.1 Major facilitator superfamily MFS_1 [Burkholderia glumae BGR1]AJY65527.1 major Facilitator Superfamily protein [Burkholderia glumae LMG 2196 = ATCC 33617]MCM2483298.1 MFS transporter [Burkholderia glumae]MCM2506615.1 MFS transporter [Burkholderia glumae]MCM2538287.1 MFS transporter [Burkholderia glumae]
MQIGSERAWHYRWLLVIAGGVVMGGALGVRSVQGLFQVPVTLDHGWSREAFGLAFALQNLIWGISQPFTGMIADRFGSARVIFAGSVLYALGLAVMALAASTGAYTLGTGVMVGIALSGTAFGAVYGALSRLFPPEHRSWALGVSGTIGGLGQFVMVPLAQGMIDSFGWVRATFVLAAVMLAVAPLAAWLRDRPLARGAEGGDPQTIRAAVREALTHRGFWLLNIGFFACGFQLAFVAAHLPAYLLDHGMSARQASVSLAVIALANTVGTFLCGYAGGLWRRKYLLAGIYFTRVIAMALFVLLPLTPASLYVFSFVTGLIWLGTVPLTSGVVSQVFGVRYIATLFGFVFFGHQLGSFFGVWIGSLVYDAVHSYLPLWYGSMALGVVAGLVHLPINDRSVARLAAAPAARPA